MTSKLDEAIMRTIEAHGEGYALEIESWVQAMGLPVYNIYPDLRRLEREGRLSSRTSEPLPERGGRPRIYYRLANR